MKNGGPAFPRVGQAAEGFFADFAGMSLLDYFAAHAPDPPFWWKHDAAHEVEFYRWRWHYAEAMLKERDKK